MAVIEVDASGNPVDSGYDPDGKFSVNVLSLCTTPDCVEAINDNKSDPSQWLHPEDGALDGVPGFVEPLNDTHTGVAVPFNAADDARDHWLAAGEPHCADCHAPPYVEQSGNINGFAPFNYPRKAGLSRYSRGHRDITCQGCHESIHGLYPVAPDLAVARASDPTDPTFVPGIDTTSYAQAANLNADGSHGPLKCGACHAVNSSGVPSWFRSNHGLSAYSNDFDAAVGWQHEFTEDADPRVSMCLNCHEDYSDRIADSVTADNHDAQRQWQRHAEALPPRNGGTPVGRAPRNVMDQVEQLQVGHVVGFNDDGEPDADVALAPGGVCVACHRTEGEFNNDTYAGQVDCGNLAWKEHLAKGRSNREVWAAVSEELAGSTCGW
jgi:hypothetical protein